MNVENADPGRESPVSAASVRSIVDRLLAAQAELARWPADDIIDVLDHVIGGWLAPDSPWRLRAEAVIADATGFSPPMVQRGLPLLLEPLRGDSIRRLLEEEVGGPSAVDGAGRRRPKLIAHVLPGNVPALAASPACLSLAVKAAALLKPGSGDRWFPGLFARSVAETDADLGRAIAVCYWHGGERDVEQAAFAAADVVEAAGSDEAVGALGARVGGRFIGHGSRISCAFLGHEVVTYARTLTKTARRLAEDIALWDQQGCLSPQVVFVETNVRDTLDRVAGELGGALTLLARELPPRRLSLDEQARVLRFRQEAEWTGIAGHARRVLSGGELSWTIVVEDEPRLEPTCLHRTVRLQPVARASQMASAMQKKRRWLECAGLAVDARRYDSVAASLAAAGIHRVCPIGAMQRPDLSWKPGGRPRVADWFQ